MNDYNYSLFRVVEDSEGNQPSEAREQGCRFTCFVSGTVGSLSLEGLILEAFGKRMERSDMSKAYDLQK